jgi:hypothetical protein
MAVLHKSPGEYYYASAESYESDTNNFGMLLIAMSKMVGTPALGGDAQ